MEEHPGVELSVLEDVWLKAHDRQEALCAKCLTLEGMLCSGLRPVFDEDASNGFNALVTSHSLCSKARAQEIRQAMKSRLQRACVPMPAALPILTSEQYPSIDFDENNCPTVNGNPFPVVATGKAGIETSRKLFGLVVGACAAGMGVKYIAPHWWYNQAPWTWQELGFDECLSADLVIVDRLDAKNGSDTNREQMFSMVESRVAAYQATIVTLTDSPQGKTETEEQIIKEIQNWPQAPL